MLPAILEFLGEVSGYKDKYEQTKWALTMANATIKHADQICAAILELLEDERIGTLVEKLLAIQDDIEDLIEPPQGS